MGRILNTRSIGRLFKEAAIEWDQDNVSRLAAALAYYTTFSLAPLLVIVIAMSGFLFGEEAARGQIVGEIQSLIGRRGAELVQNVIQEAHRPEAGVLATVVGLVILVIGATGAFNQLQDGLNHVWGVTPRPRGFFGSLLRTRLVSFAMVLATGFLLLVSLVLSAAFEAFGSYLQRFLPVLPFGPGVLNTVLSFLLVMLLFAMIYVILPDAEVRFRDIWLGAAVTSLLFTLGKHLIGLYLGNSSIGSAYGAAGALAVLLFWIYFSAHVFYFGAELTQVYTRMAGRPIRPAAHATHVVRLRVEADSLPEARALAVQELAAAQTSERKARRELASAPEEAALKVGLPKVIQAIAKEDRAEDEHLRAQRDLVVHGSSSFPAGWSGGPPAARGRLARLDDDAEAGAREEARLESWADRFSGVVSGLIVGIIVAIAGTRRIIQGEGPGTRGAGPRALPAGGRSSEESQEAPAPRPEDSES